MDFVLRRLGIGRIAVCGTQYPACIRATLMDGIAYGYETACLTDATSAATQDVAEANIRDLLYLGVACQTVEEFKGNLAA
jgi:nicotinamidase-related amidase